MPLKAIATRRRALAAGPRPYAWAAFNHQPDSLAAQQVAQDERANTSAGDDLESQPNIVGANMHIGKHMVWVANSMSMASKIGSGIAP
jgi:hypothetical protein